MFDLNNEGALVHDGSEASRNNKDCIGLASQEINILDKRSFCGKLALKIYIYKGRPKSIYLQPIRDKVKIKLASWKAFIISNSCRVQLVNSMVQIKHSPSHHVHLFLAYKCIYRIRKSLNCTFGPLSFQKLRLWPPN
ncbi:hypothetical protein MTR_5g066910 [Medicago truncatula]|uniref:Uncharacterized protein n=1 Tax=Medicago truncatula TaxID=3880 RepID=G7JYJ1_MEDTR|nr:hypothetical protein MTR_5g066910 [Medicago truncatula]